MSDYAAGTMSQDSLWMFGMGETSVAPGGGWVALPEETRAEMWWDFIWIYLYGEKTEVRKVSHGVKGTTTVGVAMERVMAVERETLQNLAKQGFRGRAIAVWSPIVVNGTVVA